MNVTIKTIVAAICAVALATGMTCEAKKSPKIKNEKVQAETLCQQLQEEKPAVRTFAEATNSNQSFAKTYAEGMARAEFARRLSTQVNTATKAANNSANAFASNGEKGGQVTDQTLNSEAFAQQLAEESVNGLAVIKTETYRLKDKQYHVFVCMEYMGGEDALAQDLTDAYMARVNQSVNESADVREERRKAFFNRISRQLRYMNGETE